MAEPAQGIAGAAQGLASFAARTARPDAPPAAAPTARWRQRLLALALGLAAALGFVPVGWWPVALLAVGAFVHLAARAPGWREAALLGWLFGWSHFTFSNNWIATAFTHQAAMPPALGWLAVPLLALYLAVYPALAAGAARALARSGPGLAHALLFAGLWVVAEWLRSFVFTGYSWNPFAMVLLGPFERPGLAALAPYAGTYALSGLAVLAGALVVLGVLERHWLAAAALTAALLAGMAWPAPAPQESALRVTVVQPDIRQAMLNRPELYEANYRRLADLSRPTAAGGPRIVLWPESGMADYLRDGYPQRYYDATTALGSPAFARRRLGAAVGADSVLLTGAVDLEFDRPGPAGRAIAARNAVTALAPDGRILGGYAKAHLVPYGEYLPMRALLEPLGLSRLVPGAIDFWPGPGPATIELGRHGAAGIQICYEIIFSGKVTDRAERPDYIFNPSNDGWFGAFGPPQHLAQARMRAVEEGLPVLRSTTTGISAVIDAAGVVRAHLPTGVAGRIDTAVPLAFAPTPFARFGHVLTFFWAGAFLAAGFIALRRARR